MTEFVRKMRCARLHRYGRFEPELCYAFIIAVARHEHISHHGDFILLQRHRWKSVANNH